MRDLKRPNAKMPAYRSLSAAGMEVFVPLTRRRGGKGEWEERPLVHGLLFVHARRCELDPVVGRSATLQYRYLPRRYREPMTVPEADMERFILAVTSSPSFRYYRPEEVTAQMCGRRIRIVGGTLDGLEGRLLTTRGSKVRRLLVELPGLLAVGVEVNPDYVQLL